MCDYNYYVIFIFYVFCMWINKLQKNTEQKGFNEDEKKNWFDEEEYNLWISKVDEEKRNDKRKREWHINKLEESLVDDEDSELMDKIDWSIFENETNKEELKEICKKLIESWNLEVNQKGKIIWAFIEIWWEKRPSKLFNSFLKAWFSQEQALKSRLQVRSKAFKDWFGDWENFNRFYSKGFEMLVGIPGSGKSTYLKKLNIQNVMVVSPDEIRREITGSISDQSRNGDVRKITEERINQYLSEGKYVILDATNINTKLRTSFINRIKHNNRGINTYATLFDTNPEESKRRIAKDIENKVDRSVVPDHVVDRMYFMYKQTVDVIQSEGFTKVFSSSDRDNVSKVVDENGEPLLVYHGSARRFKEFNTNEIGSTTGDKSGFYFSNNRKISKGYYSTETGNWWDNIKVMLGISRKYKSTVYDCFIRAFNPYIHNFDGNRDNIGREELIAEKKESGYDCVILKNIIDGPSLPQDVYVVFHPNQIKMEHFK